MSIEIITCPSCANRVGIHSQAECPSCRSQLPESYLSKDSSPTHETVNQPAARTTGTTVAPPITDDSVTDEGKNTAARTKRTSASYLLARASMACSMAGVLSPIAIVMLQLGLRLAFQVTFAFSVVAVILGLAAIYPIAVSKASMLRRWASLAFVGGLAAASSFFAYSMNEVISFQENAMLRNNIKQVLLAAHNYHDQHGHFPTDIIDENGTPILSWRVAILPYLLEGDLQRQFHLNEPWNSEHNRRLISAIPKMFQRPGADIDAGSCLIERVIGSSNFQTLTERVRFKDLNPNAAETLFLLEVNAASARPWTQPGGFDLSSSDAVDHLPMNEVFVGIADGSTDRFSREEIVQRFGQQAN